MNKKQITKGGMYIKNRKRKIAILVIILLVIIISTFTVSLAKYMTRKKASNSIEIVNPIFSVEGNEITKISAIRNIGYYEFSIKNYDGENISKLGFLYTIEVISETDESIQFELYREDEQIELNDLKTNELYIAGNEKIEQKYKLKVTYDKSKGKKGQDILQEVQVKVHSEQEQKV